MSKDHEPEVIVYSDSDAISVFVDGVKIAKRGHPGTPQAMTWVSLERKLCGASQSLSRRRAYYSRTAGQLVVGLGVGACSDAPFLQSE
jgi:hypothetical protein